MSREVLERLEAGPDDAACALAQAVPLAARDAGLPEGKRKELAAAYADRALARLREAVKHGYRDAALMKKDTDLDALRGRTDFQEPLKGLEDGRKP